MTKKAIGDNYSQDKDEKQAVECNKNDPSVQTKTPNESNKTAEFPSMQGKASEQDTERQNEKSKSVENIEAKMISSTDDVHIEDESYATIL